MRELKIFSGRANPDLSARICEFLHLPQGRISLSDFPDGEVACKIDEDVRGRDVFLIQPTCPPVNDNILELLIMIDSCVRASAARITAVMPYFGYARQDRKTAGRTPISAKLVADLIQQAGDVGIVAVQRVQAIAHIDKAVGTEVGEIFHFAPDPVGLTLVPHGRRGRLERLGIRLDTDYQIESISGRRDDRRTRQVHHQSRCARPPARQLGIDRFAMPGEHFDLGLARGDGDGLYRGKHRRFSCVAAPGGDTRAARDLDRVIL